MRSIYIGSLDTRPEYSIRSSASSMLRMDASTGPMEPGLPSVRSPFNRIMIDSICEFIDSKRTYEVVDGCIEPSLPAIQRLRLDASNTLIFMNRRASSLRGGGMG